MTLEIWAEADAYEAYVGRWSRLVARQFLEWIDRPPQCDWLDLGCGTGALTRTILDTADPRRIVGIDRSAGFLRAAAAASGRAVFATGDAREIPLVDACVDVAVSGLAINFVPEVERAAAELARVVRDGGCVATYVWDYAGEMQFMRIFWDEAAALRPEAAHFDEGLRFPLCNRDALHALFAGAGLEDVAVEAIDVTTGFRDFDDFWTPFLGGQGPAPTYVAALSAVDRDALRDRLHHRLTGGDDRPISLVARALAVRGRRPDR